MRYFVQLAVLLAAIMLFSAIPQGSVADKADSIRASAAVNISDREANIVIEFQDPSAFARIDFIAASHGLEFSFRSVETGIAVVEHAGIDDSIIAELAAVPGVMQLSSEVKARTTYTPNDPQLSLQWGLDTVNAIQAWDITIGDRSVVVAVLDTGIDWNHPDLAPNIWNDSSGYHGYNFISNNRYPMDDNINSYDENGIWHANTYTYHGTHVAGVVGAATDNSRGIAGISQVRLMAVKVMNDSGEGTDATVASGVRWAVDNGADVVTMSLGVDGPSAALENSILYASSHGVVLIAASGNSGASYISYPAAYPEVISVGAVDNTDRRASWSNFGPGLDLMAPGVQVYSTQGGGDRYQYLSGTSTAAPFVAGVAALMLSMNPVLTPVEISSVLNITATDLSISGYDTSTGWGTVNAFSAVESVSSPRVTITSHPDFVTPNSTYSITWMVSGGDPGNIQSTYLAWGTSSGSLTHLSDPFNGTTWATFTVDNLPALNENGTIYLRVFAQVDGLIYQSELLTIEVHDAPPQGLLAQFFQDVQHFIVDELGVFNFLIILAILIIVPAIAFAMRPKRARIAYEPVQPQARSMANPQTAAYYHPPPPPPPPRFETYIDVVGQDIVPNTVRVVEGTKVVWVNRTWAPPPGVMIKSGTVDQAGEHPDGLFQSGLLIAPGDYWSATFHRSGTYDYYMTGVWKTARIVVHPYSRET